MGPLSTSSSFVPPSQRDEPVVINTHMFQDSFGALPGRRNGVGGSATVHARQALELGDQGVMVAPSNDPMHTLSDIALPAATYAFKGNSAHRHDEWYEPSNRAFLVEQVMGSITGRNDILYAHMPISGQIALEHSKLNKNPLVYLGHAWETISATFFPSRDLKPERLVTEYAIICHLAKSGGGFIVTNSNWEADTIAEAYSKPPTEEHLRRFMAKQTGGVLTPLQERQIAIASKGALASVAAMGTLPSAEQIRSLCIPNPIGVDLNDFNPARRAVVREQQRLDRLLALNIPGDAVVVGSIGRIHPQKDPMESIRLFHQAYNVLGQNRPNMHLLLAGPADRNSQGDADGYYKTVLDYLEQSHGEIRHLVHIPGEQDCPVSINSILDVRLDTAQFETWGLSLQEALAMGVPSVVKRNPVYQELYGGTPVIISNRTDDLAEPLAKLIKSEGYRAFYGKACGHIGGRYNWEASTALLGQNVLSRLDDSFNLRAKTQTAGKIS